LSFRDFFATGPDVSTTMTIGPAETTEIEVLARLWYDGWQDAHADILPPELRRARTLESFAERLGAALDKVHVARDGGRLLGFYMLKGDELDQLYVAPEGRGMGVAAALISDAEERLAHNGTETAWLACAIGNDRAASFYEKSGWRRTGVVIDHLDTIHGPFDLEVWLYEKRLDSGQR
jgi:GNAT superfamily N-acetyltransferase